MSRELSRRKFLRLAGSIAGGLALTSCGVVEPSEVVETVERVVSTLEPTLVPPTLSPTETRAPEVVEVATEVAINLNPSFAIDGPMGAGGPEGLSPEQLASARSQFEAWRPYVEEMVRSGYVSGVVNEENPTGLEMKVVLNDDKVVLYAKREGVVVLPIGTWFDMEGINVPRMSEDWESRQVTELFIGEGVSVYYDPLCLSFVRADENGNIISKWNHSEAIWQKINDGLFQLTEENFGEMREAVERDASPLTKELHKQYGLIEIAQKRLEISAEDRSVDINFYGSEALIRAMATSGLRPGFRAANPVALMEAYLEAEDGQDLFKNLLTPYRVHNNEAVGNFADRTLSRVVARGIKTNENGEVNVGDIEIFDLPNDFGIDMILLPLKDLTIYQSQKPVSDDNVFWMIPENSDKEVRVGGVVRINGETIVPIVKNRISTALHFVDSSGLPVLADPVADSLKNRMWSFFDENQKRLILVMGMNEQSVLNPGDEVNRADPLSLFLAYNYALDWVANLPAMIGFSGGGNMTEDEVNRWLLTGNEIYAQGFEDSCPVEYEAMFSLLRLVLRDIFGSDGSSPFVED